MSRLSTPRAIVFDWDNTLIDSWETIRAAMNATLAAMDRPTWSLDETRRQVARSLRDAFPAMFGARWHQARDIFYREFEARHLAMLRPLPGAYDMLEALAAMDVRLAVVSNKNGSYLRQEAAHLGWDVLFDRLVGATDAPADKPDPAPVRLALEPTGIAPGAEVWLAGDAPIDMECAVNAGCIPILLRGHPPDAEEFSRHPPRHYFDAFSALTGLVRDLSGPISLGSP